MERQQGARRETPVIDAHHHLFDRLSPELARIMGTQRFLLEDYLGQLTPNNAVIATVAIQCRSMLRAQGPEELRGIGEIEFLNGQAAMAASGLYGPTLVAAGIVAACDLRDDHVRGTLETYCEAVPIRLKGFRQDAVWDADPAVCGNLFGHGSKLYTDDDFRRGFRELEALGLSFDAFVLAPQLSDVTDLARAFPATPIILNHVGKPVGIASYAGRLAELFPQWERDMRSVAACDNVTVKLGGLGSFLMGSPTYRASPPASVDILVTEWRPYIETAIELFGADRCMFESNLPTDGAGDFGTILAVFRTITEGCTFDEQCAIFAGTAHRVYRLKSSGVALV